jgi:hypothetical protein
MNAWEAPLGMMERDRGMAIGQLTCGCNFGLGELSRRREHWNNVRMLRDKVRDDQDAPMGSAGAPRTLFHEGRSQIPHTAVLQLSFAFKRVFEPHAIDGVRTLSPVDRPLTSLDHFVFAAATGFTIRPARGRYRFRLFLPPNPPDRLC